MCWTIGSYDVAVGVQFQLLVVQVMMCWFITPLVVFYACVSVAGCLGYDVLAVRDSPNKRGWTQFQLLVVQVMMCWMNDEYKLMRICEFQLLVVQVMMCWGVGLE